MTGEKAVNINSPGNVTISAHEAPKLTFWSVLDAVVRVGASGAEFSALARSAQAVAMEGVEAGGKYAGAFEAIPDEDGEKIADHITKVSGKYINKGLDHLRKIIPLWSAGKKTRKRPQNGSCNGRAWVWGKFLLSCIRQATALAQDHRGDDRGHRQDEQRERDCRSQHLARRRSCREVDGDQGRHQRLRELIKASLNSYGKASVYGAFGTSIKAMAGDLEAESDYKVKIAAKKNVAIASRSEHVFITGEEDVRVSRSRAPPPLHGKEGFYAGYAGGVSFGVVGKEKEAFGQHSSGCGDPKSVKGKTDGALIAFKQGVVDMMVSEDSIRPKSGKRRSRRRRRRSTSSQVGKNQQAIGSSSAEAILSGPYRQGRRLQPAAFLWYSR